MGQFCRDLIHRVCDGTVSVRSRRTKLARHEKFSPGRTANVYGLTGAEDLIECATPFSCQFGLIPQTKIFYEWIVMSAGKSNSPLKKKLWGGTSSLRAPAHHHKSRQQMVDRRGEMPLVHPTVVFQRAAHPASKEKTSWQRLRLRWDW
jgi:hypothetical protein